ncbi:MAG: hypothetical protein AAB152_17230 [Candidatus Coatesbacteria bacterium]
MATPAVALLVVSALGAAAPPAPASAITATTWSGAGQIRYGATRAPGGGGSRLAWRMTKDEDGKPFLEAYAFLLMETTFSLTGELYPWPVICDQYWSWDGVHHGFVLVSAGWNGAETPCTFQGTVYFKATLIPRSDVRPVVTVSVEGAQGSVPVPVRILLDERRQTDWTGIPVVLGQISTTELADGFQRLRVTGGWREYQVDGNPGTTDFEGGGDANIAFVVQNGPPRLTGVTVLTGSATAYDGSWTRDGVLPAGRLIFTRTGGTVAWPRGATGPQGLASFRFSVPVGQVTVELRRADGTAVGLDPGHAEGTGDLADAWTAILDAGDIPRGDWTFRVSARDSAGRELEPLRGDAVPLADLGTIEPGTGNCVAHGQPCRLGADTAHRITVKPGMMAHGR